MKSKVVTGLFPLIASLIFTGFLQDRPAGQTSGLRFGMPLVPASATMTTAWDIPKNPLTDSIPGDPHLAEQIRLGFRLFTDTHNEAPHITGNKVSCGNCHLNAGQREKALPLVGVVGMFPEYNKRSARLFSLEDRIVGCFMRSQNATGNEKARDAALPSTTSKEVLAISAYIAWLSRGYPAGIEPPWRGHNTIPAGELLPLEKFNPALGEKSYMEKCSSCHGEDGQGVAIGDKIAGPLWGPDSWNDGAGAARVYTLAGMIRYMMPYLDPGSLTDEEAQHIAAFINSKQRPVYPFKKEDYHAGVAPPDAVYYKETQEKK